MKHGGSDLNGSSIGGRYGQPSIKRQGAWWIHLVLCKPEHRHATAKERGPVSGNRFVRYADDFVVVCKDRQQAQAAFTLVETVMTELGLSLSPEKAKVWDITRRCNLHEQVVVMTPHSIPLQCRDDIAPEEATNRRSPGAGKPHAGKYEEFTSSRQRGGSGWPYPPTSALPSANSG